MKKKLFENAGSCGNVKYCGISCSILPLPQNSNINSLNELIYINEMKLGDVFKKFGFPVIASIFVSFEGRMWLLL